MSNVINLDQARIKAACAEYGLPEPAEAARAKLGAISVNGSEFLNNPIWICRAPDAMLKEWPDGPQWGIYSKGNEGFLPLPNEIGMDHNVAFAINFHSHGNAESSPVAKICGELKRWDMFDDLMKIAPKFDWGTMKFEKPSDDLAGIIEVMYSAAKS